jgi:hypothetical protein
MNLLLRTIQKVDDPTRGQGGRWNHRLQFINGLCLRAWWRGRSLSW